MLVKAEPTTKELLQVAMDAAYKAGQRTLAYFNAGVEADIKADNTPVTIADKEAEQILRARIAQDFPHHSVLGEEEGETEGETSDYRWILDPIDGTKAFITGVPLYGVLVGVEVRGVATVGVIYHPPLGDMVAAGAGLGCAWNGRPCRVSERKMEDAVVVTSSILRCEERSDAFSRLVRKTRLQRTWGDAFGYTLVATGRAEIMLDPRIAVWDCAPMLPILSEAGGFFGDWSGNGRIWGPDAFATTARLKDEVLSILASEKRPSV